MILAGLLFGAYVIIAAKNPNLPFHLFLLPIIIVLTIYWLIRVNILLFRGIRVTSWFLYSNVAVVVLILILFYIGPVILWATWDLYILLTNNSPENTIWDSGIPTITSYNSNIDTNNISSYNFGAVFLLNLYWESIVLNLGSFIRIIELDFVIIVGISSIVIGFAEGYSIVAIMKGLYTGRSISKTGRVASRSSPKVMVILSRTVFLSAWFTLAWDKFVVIWITLTVRLNLPFLPDIEFPRFFQLLLKLTVEFALLGRILFVISILMLPLYFVITSSFKFLSVTLIAEKMKNDNQTFFYLISSAYILIISNILADISSSDDFTGTHSRYLPFRGIAIEELLPFVSKIFELFEAVGFFIGFGFSLYVFIKWLFSKIKTKLKN